MLQKINEYSLEQGIYAKYKGETEAHIRAAKGYSRRHRHGSSEAHTRRAWKTAWEARRKLKGFRPPKGFYQRVALTRLMGKSNSKHWKHLMKRANMARLDPSIPYGLTRAGRDPRFLLTIGEEQKMKQNTVADREIGTTTLTRTYADDTPGQRLSQIIKAAKQSITEAFLSTSSGAKTASRGVRRSITKNGSGIVNRPRRSPTAVGRLARFGRLSSKTMKTATATSARNLSARATDFAAKLAQRRARQQNKSQRADNRVKNASSKFPR